jgi:hypothetical protein
MALNILQFLETETNVIADSPANSSRMGKWHVLFLFNLAPNSFREKRSMLIKFALVLVVSDASHTIQREQGSN